MKNSLSLACMLHAGLLLSTSSFSQNSAPYNPDGNGDGIIGVTDLQDFLSTYGLAFEATASTWSCGESITYAGVGYSTVQIGSQCWFAENLRTTTYLNGEAIPQNLSDGDWSSTIFGAMAFHNNAPAYGGLYNGVAVVDTRGLCPSGWHVPTDGEWMTMEMALGMSEAVANGTGARGTDQGTQMKTSYGWHENGYYEFLADNIIWFPYSTGTNSSGFSGLPGGFRRSDGLFFEDIYSEDYDYCDDAGYFGTWWSSSGDAYLTAWSRSLHSYFPGVSREPVDIRGGYSVRCVRDAE